MFKEKKKKVYLNTIMVLLLTIIKLGSLKINAIEKGYKTCYIVAFKDGKKLKLSDVLNSTNK